MPAQPGPGPLHQLLDPGVNLWLQQFSTPWLDRWMVAITTLGSATFYMLLLPPVYWLAGRREGHRLFFLFLVSMWLNGFFKAFFALPRPSAAEGVRQVVVETSNGFPSGHAQGSVTLWGFLAAEHRRIWPLSVLVIVLVCLSRLYLGVHYLADVAGGLVIGAAVLALFELGARRGWGSGWPRPLKLLLAVAVPLALWPVYRSPTADQELGFLMGLLVSDLWALEAVAYEEGGLWWQQVLKVAIGLGGFALLFALHGLLLPGEGLLSMLGYALISPWVTVAAPWIFTRLGLSAPRPPRPA
ncbi:MAG: phosphatase PAP2 family protein [Bacillota bacterium]|nr:phosphatase PAP2 family protein [Bacillota bacterium]